MGSRGNTPSESQAALQPSPSMPFPSSHEIAQACEQAAKNAILDNETTVRDSDLGLALEERRGTHG